MTGQPPTPDEIRSLYVETLARSRFARGVGVCGASWDSSPEWAETYIAGAVEDVAALAAAGLVPDIVDSRYIGRGMQRRWRLATGWKEPGE